MTAIIKQKSTILPEIPKNKCEKANRSRVSVN